MRPITPSAVSPRPQRLRAPDFAGRLFSLPDGPESWECLDGADPARAPRAGKDLLLLGKYPGNLQQLPFVERAILAGATVYILAGPDAQTEPPAGREYLLPPQARHVEIAEAVALAPKCGVYFYRPGLRLFPDFWGPLVARIQAAMLRASLPAPEAPPCCARGSVWLPGNERQLLHQELRRAFASLGYTAILEDCPPRESPMPLARQLALNPPNLALSVNFRGLDSEGRIFSMLRTLDIPVAVWLVDNPWHLLSGVKFPWWRNAHIFVTDPSFIPDLKKYGAAHVEHLPLAAAEHMWEAGETCHESGSTPPLFVGRSAFPEKASFFAGARLDKHITEEAAAIISGDPPQDKLPDYHWWIARYDTPLWPGNGSRAPGCGADMASALNRARWLQAAIPHGLEIIGDNNWSSLLPQARILPEVDYYTRLPALYNRSRAILNVTSLLLPHSLNQRHLDVWAAGGLLLTDNTPGLRIFPQELVAPIVLRKPSDFWPRLKNFMLNPDERNALIASWREHLRKYHTYAHRLKSLLAQIGCEA